MTEDVQTDVLSKEEASLYDRQIRLWGLDAQKRLRSSRLCLVGIGGLGAEVAKNITLAGIKSILLIDDATVSTADRCCQFFVEREDFGKNRAEASRASVQRLNPMVDVSAEACPISDKGAEFFKDFDVVCVTNCCIAEVKRINEICRENSIKFYCGDVYGFFGYLFSDLGEHHYAEQVERPVKHVDGAENVESLPAKQSKVETETVTLKKTSEFCMFHDAMQQKWSGFTKRQLARTPSAFFALRVVDRFRQEKKRRPSAGSRDEDIKLLLSLRDAELQELGLNQDLLQDTFASHVFGEIAPVAAIVGGILGQEIIKAVSQKDEPHNNFFFYNGLDGSGIVDAIGYKP